MSCAVPVCLDEEALGKLSPPASSTISENERERTGDLKEHDYIGLSEATSAMDRPQIQNGNEMNLNFKETELRLGLPGSLSPVRGDTAALPLMSAAPVKPEIEEKQLFPVQEDPNEAKTNVQSSVFGRSLINMASKSGAKRGFTEAMESRACLSKGFSKEGNWVYPGAGSDAELSKSSAQTKFLQNGNPYMGSRPPAANSGGAVKDIGQSKMMPQDRTRADAKMPQANDPIPGISPAAKQQVVGWPPIRSFRKNTLAATPKVSDDSDGKSGSSALYVKVSMDGAPYLRKVDLKIYTSYQQLSCALEKMFSCFTIGQCGTHAVPGRDGLTESKLMDLLHGSEYVLTYEDKDGDWMLVGDVPWEMFTESCRRLRIMKGSEAIGLAPRAMEKCRNRN
eukprot:TRINITY_DN2459_c0_g1_i1.p1 TRINITY_DN2459_c0_g1~~TRINITY_DN2459_c0_g1_i1.p1  ORF type:complete len:394 (+),score=73.09 TRINITY_DN2459_c0_g1_i1:378-1559(+)